MAARIAAVEFMAQSSYLRKAATLPRMFEPSFLIPKNERVPPRAFRMFDEYDVW